MSYITQRNRPIATLIKWYSDKKSGKVVRDEDGKLFHHTHALFSFKEDGQHGMAGGHLKATTVLYTAEIELRPTVGGAIGRKFDPETGTGFWHFKD